MDGLAVVGVIVVVLWVVPIGLGYRITKDKGYEPWLGLALGFFLGWIGVLVCAVLTDKRQRPSGLMRACPHCAEQIQPEAKVCRFCGRDVEQPVSAS